MLLSDLSADDDAPRLSNIVACFARFWDDDYRCIAVSLNQLREDVADIKGRYSASFLQLLRRTMWIPGTDGYLHFPCDVFSGAASEARAIFQDWAVFVAPAAETGVGKQQLAGFYNDIGVCAELTLQFAIRLLNERCTGAQCMKISTLRKIYKYMDENWNDSDLEICETANSESHELPMIFVPDRATSSHFDCEKTSILSQSECSKKRKEKYFELLDKEDISGVWLRPVKCVWSDPSYLVDSLRMVVHGFNITHEMNNIATSVIRSLRDYYGDRLRSFFIEKLKVRDTPASSIYVDIMCRAAKEYHTNEPHAVACILRVMNHFAYIFRDLKAEQASDYHDTSEYIELKQSSSKILVPNALFTGFVRLEDVCWSADTSTCNQLLMRGFGDTVLTKCVPIEFSFDCPCGVFDSEAVSGFSKRGNILIHELNMMQGLFYEKVWLAKRLSGADLRQRVEVLPSAGGASDWPTKLQAEAVPICHVLSRALQRWCQSHMSDSAMRDEIRARVVALSLVVVAEPVLVQRRWIFVSPFDGSTIEGNNTAETKAATCVLDCVAPEGPRLYITADLLTLQADPEAVARCFAELAPADAKVLHPTQQTPYWSSSESLILIFGVAGGAVDQLSTCRICWHPVRTSKQLLTDSKPSTSITLTTPTPPCRA
jgi:hypothetical protein